MSLLRDRLRRPCRRSVDRAAMENVKLWKCGNMEVWKYGNGLLVLPVAGGNDACGEYAQGGEFRRKRLRK